MSKKLESQYKKFEQDRKSLLDSLQSISNEKLNLPPAADKWSVIQILNHLIMAEYGTFGYLKKKIKAVDSLEKAGFTSWLGYQFIKINLALPIKTKAPKGIDQPAGDEKLVDVIAKWDKLRADWFQFLAQIKDGDLEKAIFKHPFGSRLNIYQTIGFCDDHFKKHEKQIKNILK